MKKFLSTFLVIFSANITAADQLSLSPPLIIKEAIPAAGTYYLPVELPASERILVYIPNVPGLPVESAALVDKDGQPVAATTTAVTASEDASRLLIPYDGWVIESNDIAPGLYHIEGASSHNDTIPIQVRIIGSETGFLLFAGNPERDNRAEEPVPLTVILAGPSGLNTTSSVTFRIFDGGTLIDEAMVFDNGENGDFIAEDGSYNHLFEPADAGKYFLEVELHNTDYSNPNFVANLSATLNVVDLALSLSDAFVETTPDADSDGYFDEMVITYTLDDLIPADETVKLYSQIKVGETLLEDFRAIAMPATSLSSRFDGKALRAAEYDGEISIEQTVVTDSRGSRFVRMTGGTTAFYRANQWEREDLELIAGITDTAIDENGDGFQDRIDISFLVDSIVFGEFGMSAAVYDDSGEKIGVIGNAATPVVVGENTLTISVPGREFAAAGTNSRLELRNLFMYPNNGGDSLLQAAAVGTTESAYDCWDFAGCTNGPNTEPVAVNDAVTSTGSATVINVVANDVDADGDLLAVREVGIPTNGIAEIVGNAVRYTPNTGFNGTDSFTYLINDVDPDLYVWKGGASTATVTVDVLINNLPIANDDAYTVASGVRKQLFVLDNDSDADGDRLYINAVTQPSNGSVTNYGNSVVIDTPPEFFGDLSFTYTILDVDNGTNVAKGGSDTATVTVAVGAVENRPPVAVDDVFTVPSTGSTSLDVLSNDSDPDGDAIYISQYTGAQKGSVSLSGQEIVYTPNSGATGEDSFSYVASDLDGATSTATVTILIEEQNQPPVANNDDASTIQDTPVVVDVLSNDYDPNGDPLSVSSFTQASHGAVLSSGSAFEYQPSTGFTGSDQFTYTVTDGEFTASAVVVLTVVPESVNQPPVVEDDQASVVAGEQVTLSPLSNDTDPEGQPLTITAVTQPSYGTVSLAGDRVIYQAEENYEGADTFTYTVSDGELEAVGSITITTSLPSNTAPVIDIVFPASGSTHSVGEPVMLSAIAEDAEEGDISSQIIWSSNMDGTLFTGASGAINLSKGQHTLKAVVVDSQGLYSEAETVVYVRDVSGVFVNTQNYNIPDGNGKGVASAINVPLNGSYSTIIVTVSLDHASPRDLGIQLMSPSGRRFNLDNPNVEDSNHTWKFEVKKGVEASGEWTLRVADQKKGKVGSLTGWTIAFE